MERKKRERYSTEFKQQAVERMNACDNITRLSRELGVARHLLYYWRDRWLHAHPQPGLYREVCLRKQIQFNEIYATQNRQQVRFPASHRVIN